MGKRILFWVVSALVLFTVHDLSGRGEFIAAAVVTMGYIIQMALGEIRDAIRETNIRAQPTNNETRG